MFAVPGWSVSADSLKSEKAAPTAAAAAAGGAKPSRKRKRAGNGGAGSKEMLESVTASNVADLWESVVEGKKKPAEKAGPTAKKQKNKKQKTTKGGDDNDDGEQEAKGGDGVNGSGEDKPTTTQSQQQQQQQQQAPSASKKNKKQKSKNKDNPKNVNDQSSEPPPPQASSTAAAAPPALPPAPPKLTPLQASMRQKLVSARFRHLNETLYTRPSAESLDLFASDPTMFGEYHEGFRRQVRVWPENPVDSFLADLRSRGKARSGGPPSRRGRSSDGGKKDEAGARGKKADVLPLPRTQGTCVIADLGCGDARLAQELQADKDKLRLDVRSYDLQSPHPLVTRADVADLPLADGSVNVAIFCLALMGTNWIDFVEEAYRVLHWKGELWVAEIKSRFGPARRDRGRNAPVAHSVGNRKKAAAKKGKAAEDGNDEDLAVEVDGQDDRRRETDVSAFVEALGKRGFVLQGGDRNQAVDLSNKMFVKMHFVKGAAPTRGKGVKEAEAKRPPSKGMQKWRQQVQDDEDDDGNDEAAILKPCVYKIR
ncbi:hypothetical protein N3K66_002027 [Trichothecium roseum]|uniref:Uncharacterized protein n=1 Tax=Trichothecium roseum TaxID=47278 RepID=A0ACC0VAD6_9HYPO|nr:hypothetical protein N3K66_002027 [Trichothecium roseum]